MRSWPFRPGRGEDYPVDSRLSILARVHCFVPRKLDPNIQLGHALDNTVFGTVEGSSSQNLARHEPSQETA